MFKLEIDKIAMEFLTTIDINLEESTCSTYADQNDRLDGEHVDNFCCDDHGTDIQRREIVDYF